MCVEGVVDWFDVVCLLCDLEVVLVIYVMFLVCVLWVEELLIYLCCVLVVFEFVDVVVDVVC